MLSLNEKAALIALTIVALALIGSPDFQMIWSAI